MGTEEPLAIKPAEMKGVRSAIQADFIHLKENFVVTSKPDPGYNCFAWAACEQDRWWGTSPDDYWPEGIAKERTVEAFQQAFALLNYIPCEDGLLEVGFLKIALFTRATLPTHMARQFPSGRWTTKLGEWFDIALEDLESLSGGQFGGVTHFFKRALD